MTDARGRAALDFCTQAGCDQLVCGPTHVHGGVLDLLITDVPDLVNVSVSSPIGGSDHSSLSVVINVRQRTPDITIRKEVFLKSRVDWDAVTTSVKALPWREIRSSMDPGACLDRYFSEIVQQHVPTRVILVRSRDAPWFDDACRRAYQMKQEAFSCWSVTRSAHDFQRFKELQRYAKRVYADAEGLFRARSSELLSSSVCPHKWWSTLKSSIFGAESSIPPLVAAGGRPVAYPAEKADLLVRYFDSKQNRDEVVIPASCHPQPRFCKFAFRSRELRKLLLQLDAYGGTDPSGVFPLFFKKVANVIAGPLSAVFRSMIRLGSFPSIWRTAHITPVPKGTSSSSPSDYRPISITSVLSKVYERMIASRLGKYLEINGLLPSSQYGFRKGLGTCDALLHVSHIIQQALDCGYESRIVQVDLSSAFDRVNHNSLLFKLQSAGVGGSVLSIIQQFLTDRQQCVVVDGASSSYVDVVSGVPQGSVLGPLLFVLYIADMFESVSNILVGYADDATLVAVCKRPSDRSSVSDSLLSDMHSLGNWCSQWGMLLNPGKTKTMVVSRSRTAIPSFPALIFDGVEIEEVSELVVLGVTLDTKLTFENHIRSIVSRSSQKIGLMRRAWRVFGSVDVLRRCFSCFVLPLLEYCSPVWLSAADCHLRLLDGVVRRAAFMLEGIVPCNLSHRRGVAALCVLFKIYFREDDPLGIFLPEVFVPVRATRRVDALHQHAFVPTRCRTGQFSRSFFPACAELWNALDGSVFAGDGLDSFKSSVNRDLPF